MSAAQLRIEPTPEDLAIVQHHVIRITQWHRASAPYAEHRPMYRERFFIAIRNMTMDYIEFPGPKLAQKFPEAWNA